MTSAISNVSSLKLLAIIGGVLCILYAASICAWILPDTKTLSGKGFVLGTILFSGFVGVAGLAWGSSQGKFSERFLAFMGLGSIAGCILMIANMGALSS